MADDEPFDDRADDGADDRVDDGPDGLQPLENDRDDDRAEEGPEGSEPPDGPSSAWSPYAAEGDPDDLEGFQTATSRFVARSKGWIAAVIAVALVIPAGGWLLSEYSFGAAGDAVESALGDDAALTDAMLLVRTTHCSGRSSSGSAFAMELDGEPVIVTNRHVVDGARTIGVRPLAGGAALAVESHRLADGADVAVLELRDPDDVPPRLVRGVDPAPGDEVRIVGFPAARPSTTAGPVEEATGGQLLLDLVVDPGASGSPVLDDAGNVVGQVFARTDDGRGVATSLTALVRAARAAEPAPPC